ncbi:MAG: hypothetical protein Q4D96_03780 [Propionibacteriaceae bacterium]|nr:hypothetical protein [Propionibacteriaceae bacterium]
MTPVDILLEHLLGRLRLPARDERGLSQSTENAILLAGAVSIATLIVITLTAYVKARLP